MVIQEVGHDVTNGDHTNDVTDKQCDERDMSAEKCWIASSA